MKNTLFFKLFSSFHNPFTAPYDAHRFLFVPHYPRELHQYPLERARQPDSGAGAPCATRHKERCLPALNAELDSFEARTRCRATVINPDGLVLADSDKNASEMGNHKTRPEIAAALEGKTGSAIRFSSTEHSEMLYVAEPLLENGKVIGVLRTSMFLTDINALLGALKLHIMNIAFLLFIFSVLAAYLFSRALSSPIKDLAEMARKVSAGDFEAKVYVGSGGELKELGDAFNAMTSDVKRLFNELS